MKNVLKTGIALALKRGTTLFRNNAFKSLLLIIPAFIVVIVAATLLLKPTEAQIVVDNAYHSYDITLMSGSVKAQVSDSADTSTANIDIYISSGDFNLAPGAQFDKFSSAPHPHGFNEIAPYWTTDNPYGDYPYIGKSVIARGTNEPNSPTPLGVNDLQVHPPSTDQNLVMVFNVPFGGDYRISDLAIRDTLPWGTSATFKVFGPDQEEIASLTTSAQDWVVDSEEYVLSGLAEGDNIYLVANRDGDYVGDSIKINWTIEKITEIPDGGLAVTTNIPGLSIIVDGATQTSPYDIPSEGASSVTLYAPSPQTTIDGRTVVFESWSNGGAQEQIVARNSEALITANYVEISEVPVFSNGFEEGDTSAYPQGNIDIVPGNTLEVTTTRPRTGDYSLEVASSGTGTVTQAVIDAIPAKTNTIYISTHIALDPSFSLEEGDLYNGIAFKNENYRRMMYLSIDDDYRLHPILFDPADAGYCEPEFCPEQANRLGSIGPAIPRDGSWHEVQLRYTVDDEHGIVEVWLDGERIMQEFELNTGTAGVDDINVVTWGTFFSSHDIVTRSFFDDLSIGHTYINSIGEGGFENEEFAGSLEFPTYALPTPDGRTFIAQKDGTIRVWENGTILAEPLVVIPNVNTFQDRGLISLALDPDFQNNGYLYAAYTYDVNPADFEGIKTARVVRLTVDENTADLGSMQVILGTVNGTAAAPSCNDQPLGADCMPSDGRTHTVGDMKFLSDGTLLISAGEGASDLNVNDNAMRAQNLDSLGGKFLRINTAGQGLPDNPFYTGNPNDNRSKIWAYGFRNPFRFNIKPGTNIAFAGDVGWGAWEEINVIEPGKNYGWPCYEGTEFSPGYGPVYPVCQALLGTGSTTPPLHTYPHPPGSAVVGGVFYQGNSFPAQYHGAFLFGDYARSKIWALNVDENNNLIGEPFEVPIEPDGPVQFFSTANGDVYYLSIYTGTIRKLNFTTGGLAPIVEIDSDITSGSLPLTVQFSSEGTTDPDGNINSATYLWDFGDGNTSIEKNPTHVFTEQGTYTVTLKVRDVQGIESMQNIVINAGFSAPTVTITSPAENYEYSTGEVINFAAEATDAEDGILPPTALSWELTLRHCELVTSTCHNHPFLSGSGASGSFTAPDHGDGTSLILNFRAADSDGIIGNTTREILPRKVDATITSTPAGFEIVMNGTTHTTPANISVQANADNSLSVESPQTINGVEYTFVGWSDGNNEQSRTFNIDEDAEIELIMESEEENTNTIIFNSYDVEVRDGTPQLEVRDEAASVSAAIELYLSGNDNGLIPGLTFDLFSSSPHSEGFNNLAPYWTTNNPFGHYPYAGKNTVARVETEPNAPAPYGVNDLQVHPPSTSQNLILAFVVPTDGDYKISNLGIRDILPWGTTATLKVYNPAETELASLTSSGTDWVNSTDTFILENLSAGDKIHFAVNRDGDYVGDAVKINWRIEKTE